MGKIIDIPNKKINYSPQFRNLVPGENVEFEPKDHRVTEVSSQGGGSDVPIVATPVVTVDGRTVTVTCATEGAEIFYTTDGSMPTINSTLYKGPISVIKTIHFRFVAVKNGMVNSQEATATAEYFAAPVFEFDYLTGKLSILNPNTEGYIYYSTDGSDPAEQSTKYAAPFLLTVETTVKAIIGDGTGTSSVTSKTYTKCEAPTIKNLYPDLTTGFYSIVCSNENTYHAEIHYTTNGQVPSMVSPVYTEPIARNLFEGGITVKAVAFAEDHIPSDVSSLKCGESSVDAPFINVDGQTVTIELNGNTAGIPLKTTADNPTIGARIYYTTDGTNPTAQTGTLYTESFAKPAGNNRVKAITVCYGEYASGVVIQANYLTFTAEQDNSSLSLSRRTSAGSFPSLEISRDNGRTFTAWEYRTSGNSYTADTILLNAGESVCVRGNQTSMFKGYPSTFVMTGRIAATGSIMSLLDGVGGPGAQLPSNGSSTFKQLFQNCTALTSAPELSATNVRTSCYEYMFAGCTALTSAPELPATSLNSVGYCYGHMFAGCTALTSAPQLPARNLGTNYNYEYMFAGCTALTSAPELLATGISTGSYNYMFQGCSSLNYIKVLLYTWNEANTTSWLDGVSESGTFVKRPGTEIPTGTSGIPSGWTVVNI